MAQVWDAMTGEPVTPPVRHNNDANHVEFCADGRRVATASGDGTARLWEVSPGKHSTKYLLLLSQLVSCHRLDATGGDVPLSPEEYKKAWDAAHSKGMLERSKQD